MSIEMHEGCLGMPFPVTGFPRYGAALRFPYKHGGTLNINPYSSQSATGNMLEPSGSLRIAGALGIPWHSSLSLR